MADVRDDVAEKPSVIIVGGLGYIGRFLAKYIHDNQLASRVRLVDKRLPQLVYLAPEFLEACAPSICMQKDASNKRSMDAIFEHPDGKTWDYVFNVGGTNEWALNASRYDEHRQLSENLATASSQRGVKAYIQASTGTIYDSNRKPRVETDKTKPWQLLGRFMLDVEQKLSEMETLNLVILRMPHVYGPYLTGIVAKPLCLGRLYQKTGKTLNWLWSSDLQMNTVHVEDVARAFWTAADWRCKNSSVTYPDGVGLPSRKTGVGPKPGTPVFNLVDHGQTSQGLMAKLASVHFGVQTGFHNSLISQFAKHNMGFVVDELNDEHLIEWSVMCKEKGIRLPPAGPFLEMELLKEEDLSLDGSLFERTTGFRYEFEGLTLDRINEMIESYERMGWWP